MDTWGDIRSNWVNGNLKTAKACLFENSKVNMLKIIHEALLSDYAQRVGGTWSGDLIDLQEIISGIVRDKD